MKSAVLLLCVIVFIASQSGASAEASATDPEFQSNLKLAVPPVSVSSRKVTTSGEIKFEGAQYQSPVPGNTKLDQSLSVSAHLKIGIETEKNQSRFDLMGEKYLDWGSAEFSVREFYGSVVVNNNRTQATVGRKLEFWSQGDSDWHLDLWQPNQTFDGLRPDQQGLTGAFFRHEEDQIELLAFASPIFIPTLGPEIKNDDGNLSSDSRWYRSPSSTFVLFDKQRRIVYSLNMPNLEELVNKPGAGLRLVVGGRTTAGPWMAAGFARKPMNKLLVKYDKMLASSEEGEDTGSAPLFPVVAYHSLISADMGYKFARSLIAISYLSDQPEKVEQASDDPYIIQRPAPAKAYTAHADTQVDLAFLNQPVGLTLAYLRVDGGEYADYDSQGRNQGAVFTHRFQYTHAAMLQAEFRTDIRNKKLISRFKYLREFDQRGLVTSAEFTFFPVHSLGLSFGADVLGVDNTEVNNTDDRFLNQFRANDRIYAGLSYVF